MTRCIVIIGCLADSHEGVSAFGERKVAFFEILIDAIRKFFIILIFDLSKLEESATEVGLVSENCICLD